jgi:hypothetical protein
VALEHKQAVRARFLQLAEEAGARQPGALANALLLLMDGAYMAARMYGASPSNPASDVAEAARRLVEAYGGVLTASTGTGRPTADGVFMEA